MTQSKVKRNLTVDLRHGPRKKPVKIGHRFNETRFAGPVPYHGIISRGLVNAEKETGRLWKSKWAYIAPILDDVLNQLSKKSLNRGKAVPISFNDMEILTEINYSAKQLYSVLEVNHAIDINEKDILSCVKAAIEKRVLTHSQSASAACGFIEKIFDEETGASICRFHEGKTNKPFESVGLDSCQLWSVKEGHTASVWRVKLTFDNLSRECTFGINVARDEDSGKELITTTEFLGEMHSRDSKGVTEILACESIDIPCASGTLLVPVVAVLWIENARELHLVNDESTGRGKFIAVDYFASSNQNSLTGRQSLYGEVANERDTDDLWEKIITLCMKQTLFSEDHRTATTPILDINDGDLILADGNIVVVAASEPVEDIPLGHWVYYLLLMNTTDDTVDTHRSIYWNQPERVIDLLKIVLGNLGKNAPSFQRCLKAAYAVSESDLRTVFPERDTMFPRVFTNAKKAIERVIEA